MMFILVVFCTSKCGFKGWCWVSLNCGFEGVVFVLVLLSLWFSRSV